ncbi:protein phosphatase 1 regulatory subunit 17 [Lepisosteus oculatus]|uniref:protein phosphatase 1 regulatory subunit 17 n=1 Tax=Lepisosteus oculatus TaxID=7918 RepID=UPI00073FECAB|nr:PREDICTED: protein phosphatase 1 regulatory subunit 17 [Lepisosteus oculatus]XP_015210214.1 PREDICTED: protein phosphatase 1 regulatory subunit 17 [Lepisosteus oculatus]XP_015210215.1 PREDICTED: protein phosphatase 1 regulatory subunit 17 [Lepisosteus oculatus]
MSTEYVRPTPKATDNRLNGQDQFYPLSDLSEELIDDCEMDVGKTQSEKHLDTQQHEQEHKKPRRKDTPVLYIPPLIPGVKLMKEEKRVIYMEEEETEGKN